MNHFTRFGAWRVDFTFHSTCAAPSTIGAVGMMIHTTFQLAFQLWVNHVFVCPALTDPVNCVPKIMSASPRLSCASGASHKRHHASGAAPPSAAPRVVSPV